MGLRFLLDDFELGFEAGDELLFFCDLLLGLENEVGGSSFDVVGIAHAEVEIVEFAANGKDTLSESLFVFLDDLPGNV